MHGHDDDKLAVTLTTLVLPHMYVDVVACWVGWRQCDRDVYSQYLMISLSHILAAKIHDTSCHATTRFEISQQKKNS